MSEIGDHTSEKKGKPEFIPIATYRTGFNSIILAHFGVDSILLAEFGVGYISSNDHSKFSLNIDLFKTLLEINKINVTFGPGINFIHKTYDNDTSTTGGRIGLGFGLESTARNKIVNENLFYFGRLYYPAYYIHTKNATIAGSIGIMLNF